MIDDTLAETLFNVISNSGANAGTIAASLFGAYKVAKRYTDRKEICDNLIKERDRAISEYIREQLVFTRSEVFESSAQMADDAEKKGHSGIELRIKCVNSRVSFDAFLEKIDRHTKDALTEDLPKYFEKNLEMHDYEVLSLKDNKEDLKKQIMEDAIDFKKSLWNRLSKDVGFSGHFKNAYNEGFTDNDAYETCRKIMIFLLNIHSRYEQKIRDERKFFRFGRKRKA